MKTGAVTGVVIVADTMAQVAASLSGINSAVNRVDASVATLVDALSPAESPIPANNALLQMSTGVTAKSLSTATSSAASTFLFFVTSAF